MPVKCWAACLGGCSDEQSREHWVSEAVFITDRVKVHGLPWCKEDPSVIGLASATSKSLCTKHNSALSALDAAAGKAFSVMRTSLETLSRHQRTVPVWKTPKPEHLYIDAGLLERWLVKTAINISSLGRPLHFGDHVDAPLTPPVAWVELAYGMRPFAGYAGMYVAVATGSTVTWSDDMMYSPVIDGEDRIVGGFFRLFGLRLVLWMLEEKQPLALTPEALAELGPEWHGAQLSLRHERICVKHGIWPSNFILFDWQRALRESV